MAQAMKGMGLLSQSIAMLAGPENLFFASGKDAAARVRRLVSAEPGKPTVWLPRRWPNRRARTGSSTWTSDSW